MQKSWPTEDHFNDEVFENFCKLLANLDSEQRELIMSLTEEFIWVQEHEYIKYFSEVFNLFITSYNFTRGKKIYICPLLPKEDFNKTKSSVALLYFVKSHFTALQQKYPDFSITYVESPSFANFDLIKTNYTLCLIDDFIGTGETVERASQHFIEHGIDKNNIVILSLIGMKEGLLNLKDKGYITYAKIECEKGISFKGNARQADLMRNIEKSIKVSDDFLFGYGASEALVKMLRTPNNTFPIYWLRNKKNQYAPFPR